MGRYRVSVIICCILLCFNASSQEPTKEILDYSYLKDENNWTRVCNKGMLEGVTQAEIFRIPVMVVFKNGDVFISCEAKTTNNEFICYVQSLSKNGGKTFKSKKSNIPLAELIYDKNNDRIISINASACYASDDHGENWYLLSKLALQKKEGFDYVTYSPTTGIQLRNGVLVAPMRSVLNKRDEKGNRLTSIEKTVNFIIFSCDFGKTWKQSCFTPEDIITDEVTIVEYSPNRVMLNSRGGTEYFWDKESSGRRIFVSDIAHRNSRKKWMLSSWSVEEESDGVIWDPICNASIAKVKIGLHNVGLFCNPDIPGEFSPRKNLVLRVSKDFVHWYKVALLSPNGKTVYGYSAIGSCNKHIYFCYEDTTEGILLGDISNLRPLIKNILFREESKNTAELAP